MLLKNVTMKGFYDSGVSFPGRGKIYFDINEHKFKVSEDGGAYQDLVGVVDLPDFMVDNGTLLTIDRDVLITGDLTVQGTVLEELIVEDNIILLNSNVTGTPSINAGIQIERGTSANASLLWDETADLWKAGLLDAEKMLVLHGASPLDNTIPRWDGTVGNLLQSSGVVIDDSNVISGLGGILGGLNIIPTLGAEKAINGDFLTDASLTWTYNETDWTWSNTNKNLAKDQDGTNTLSQDMTEVAEEVYYVTMNVTGFSAGTFTVQVGGTVAQTANSTGGATQSIAMYFTAVDTTNFTITPSNTSRFVLDNISVKKITNAGLSLYNSLNLYGGQFLGNKGTAVYPTYSYIEDPLVGFYYINAYEIGLSLAGTRRYSFSSSQLLMDSANIIQFSGNITLSAKSSGVLALSGTSQEFRVYALDTDASNYEYASLKATAGAVTLSAGTLGAGTNDIDLILTPIGTGKVQANSTLIVNGDQGGLANTIGITDTLNTTVTNDYVVAGGQAATTHNTGWLQIYIGTAVAWIPYWTNATP